jgi:hypothetical protein
MNARLLAALGTALGIAAAAGPAVAPAGAAPKPTKVTYKVTEPVPYPMLEEVPGGNGCWQGTEGQTKNTRAITLPAKGVLVSTLDFTGDWDLYLFDAKGTIIAASATDNSATVTDANTEKLTYKKGTKGQKVSLVACNWSGLPDATVTYTFTPR